MATVFSAFAAIASASFAAWANHLSGRSLELAEEANEYSRRAVDQAEEANRIAQEAYLSQVSVEQVITVPFDVHESRVCDGQLGLADWTVETFALYDVSNLGNEAVSLVRFRGSPLGTQLTPEVAFFSDAFTFGTRTRFEEWLGSALELWQHYGYDSENMTFAAPPFVIGPGETRRVVERVSLTVRFDVGLHLAAIASFFGDVLVHTRTFYFSDGSFETERTHLTWSPRDYFNPALAQGFDEDDGSIVLCETPFGF